MEVIRYQETQEEVNSTMLVVQDLMLQKLNESLHSKENKKAQWSQVFAGGKGRHLRHHESISALCEEQDVWDEGASQKEMRWDMQVRGKVEKVRLELECNAIKAAYVTRLLQWEEECAKLISAGFLKKHGLKRPTRPPKPQPGPQASMSVVEDEPASELSSSSD